jgi:ParB family chromosome partitioning protein
MKIRGGLGRGLSELISEPDMYNADVPSFFLCPIEKIRPNPNQPRKTITEQSLMELAASIRAKGVLQPIVVREESGMYELIAGERRWKAAQMAGLRTIPVVIKDISSDEVLELALIENIQREDLNPIEEATAFKKLIDDLGLSQSQVASRVGKERSTITNSLRLLSLPRYVQEDLLEKRLTSGHARAVLMVENKELQRELREKIVGRGLSVRQAESLARYLSSGKAAEKRVPSDDPDLKKLGHDLSLLTGAVVKILPKKRGGRVEIHYQTLDDLDRIISIMRGE